MSFQQQSTVYNPKKTCSITTLNSKDISNDIQAETRISDTNTNANVDTKEIAPHTFPFPTNTLKISEKQYKNTIDENENYQNSRLLIPLSLNSKLSQSHLNEILIGIVLTIYALSLFVSYSTEFGEATKQTIAQSCTGLEVATNSLASTPFFMAKGINSVASASIVKAKDNAIKSISLALRLIKELLLYILFRYQKSLQCLVTMALSSSIRAVSQSTVEITNFVNKELGELKNVVENGLREINNQIDKANSATSGLNVNIMGVGASVPGIPAATIPGLQDRLSWQIPNSTIQTLSGLNSNAFTLKQIQASVRSAIGGPFEGLVDKISASLNAALSKRNPQGLFRLASVPERVNNIKFCSDIVPLKSIDQVTSQVQTAFLIMIAVLVVVFFLVWGWNIWVIRKSHSLSSQSLARAISRFTRPHDPNFLRNEKGLLPEIDSNVLASLHWALNFPRLDNYLTKLSSKGYRVVWYLYYCSNPLGLACFVIGLIGTLVLQLQFLIIPLIFRNLVPLLMTEISDTAKFISKAIMEVVGGAVGPYVTALNNEIQAAEDEMNAILFSHVRSIVQTVDDSVMGIFASFQEEIEAVYNTLGPMKAVVTEYFVCVVGNVTLVLDQMEAALNNDLGVNLTRVPAESFAIDPSLMMKGAIHTSSNLFANQGALSPTEEMFMEQSAALLEKYNRLVWILSGPFIILLCFGASMLILGLIAVWRDILARRKMQTDIV